MNSSIDAAQDTALYRFTHQMAKEKTERISGQTIVAWSLAIILALASVGWWLRGQFADLQSNLSSKIEAVQNTIQTRVGNMEQRVAGIEGRLRITQDEFSKKIALLNLERQVALAQPKSPGVKATAGIVQSVGQNFIKVRDVEDKSFDFTVTKNTRVTVHKEGKEEEIPVKELTTGNRVVVTYKTLPVKDKMVDSVVQYPWELSPKTEDKTKPGLGPTLERPPQ